MSAEEVLEKLIRGDVVAEERHGSRRAGPLRRCTHLCAGRIRTRRRVGQADRRSRTDPRHRPRGEDARGISLPRHLQIQSRHAAARRSSRRWCTNFRKHFGGEMNYITTGLDLHQTVTLASIVETEARMPQERPLVASVYLNRINRNMLLGADPDRHLRAEARRPLGRQHPQGRSADRLAVQHLSFSRPAARARSPIPGWPRCAPPPRRRRATSSTSSPNTTARTPSPRTSPSTTATCRFIRCSGIANQRAAAASARPQHSSQITYCQ